MIQTGRYRVRAHLYSDEVGGLLGESRRIRVLVHLRVQAPGSSSPLEVRCGLFLDQASSMNPQPYEEGPGWGEVAWVDILGSTITAPTMGDVLATCE